MILPSASKLELALRCAWPWHPTSMPWPREAQSTAAERGNKAHEAAEHHDPASAPSGYERARSVDDVARVVVDDMIATGAIVWREVALAVDPVTGTARVLPSRGARDYNARRPGEFVGTADLVAVWPGRVEVADLKTGRKAREGRAVDSAQLRMLALAVSRIVGADTVWVTLAHLDEDDYHTDPSMIDAWDLDEVRDQMAALSRAIDSTTQEPAPGRHCYAHYCPLRATCPATRAVLMRAEHAARTRLPMLGDGPQSDEEARAWRVGLKLADEWVRAGKARLDEYARRSPVDLGDGTIYGLREESRETIDLTVPGAVAAVVELAGDDAIDRSTTKAAIERATRGRQERRGDGARAARGLYERLRELGAMRESRFARVTEFRPRERQEEEV